MLHSFSCRNFYSFADTINLNFVVNNKVPQSNGYFVAPSQTRLSKIETVIGPNAAGKTNLLKGLPFLKWLIVDSFNTLPEKLFPFKPFALWDSQNKPTEFLVEFEINGDIFKYDFILNRQRILKEELSVKNITKKRATTKILFTRKWSEKSKKYIFSGNKNFNLPLNFAKVIRANASVISTAMRLNHKESREIGQFWQKIRTNVAEAGWIGDNFFLQPTKKLFETMLFFSKNARLKKEAEKLLASFDLGFESFKLQEETNEGVTSIRAQMIHSFGSKKLALPIQYESSGTKQLFQILRSILQVLAEGGVAVLDEFDVNLHPDMVLALFELFRSPEINPKNAQILFSTHSHRILNELDKYQILLTEKNQAGSSEVWRLDEMSGVRADDNYYTKYIAGAYGAIPQIS